jgi:hypothetical protein
MVFLLNLKVPLESLELGLLSGTEMREFALKGSKSVHARNPLSKGFLLTNQSFKACVLFGGLYGRKPRKTNLE